MRKFIITAELRDLEIKVNRGEISYSKMIEILNEKAEIWYKRRLQSVIPSIDTSMDRCEKEISEWLEGNTDMEKKHYRVAFKRCYEFMLRKILNLAV